MDNNKGGFGSIVIVVIVLALLLSMCSGGGSRSSGRSWSDLSATEKANARWAYSAQQAIKGR